MKESFNSFSGIKYIGQLKTKSSTCISSSRLGVGFETLDREMWDVEQAWPLLSDLGVKWARVQTGWARCERVIGVYDFQWLDVIVDGLIRRGVQPWLSLSYGNPIHTKELNVAIGKGSSPVMEPCDPFGVGFPPIQSEGERIAWQKYVRALVRHFRSRVTHYEVWNEPDLLSFWRCQPKAREYVDLVCLTVGPLRDEFPGAKIIGGAIAWGMTVWSIKFLEDCMILGLGKMVDIISYHGYKKIPERHSQQEIHAFKYVLQKYAPGIDFWQGEGGMQSFVPDGAQGLAALSTMKNSESIQARMLLRRFLLEISNGVSMTSWFHMADFSHYAQCKKTFHYGLIRLSDGSPKPSYRAMQTLATLLCDPAMPALGMTSCHMSVLDDTADPRGTKEATWHANFVCNSVPIHAWWIPESLEEEPVVRRAEMNFWMDRCLSLSDPVLIEPVSQAVYEVPVARDRRTCAESWMQPDPDSEGIRVIGPVPVCNSPMIITDRSIVEVI